MTYFDGISKTVSKVCSWSASTLFLCTDGTVYACGRNGAGSGANAAGYLGNGSSDSSTHPTPTQVGGLSSIVDISSGGDSAWALDNSGNLYGWGKNQYGALGLGDTTTRTTPTLSHTSVALIRSGLNDSVILLNDGSVLSCGRNDQGQGAVGDLSQHTSWTAISGSDVIASFATGQATTVFVLSDGTVKASGIGQVGQVGYTIYNSGSHRVTVPTSVPGLASIIEASQGSSVNFFRDNTGVVYVYGAPGPYGGSGDGTGSATYGQTSGGSPGTVAMPVACAQLTRADIAQYGSFPGFAAIGTDGLLYTWGYGGTGLMGNGATTPTANVTPVSLNGMDNVTNAHWFSNGQFAVGLGPDEVVAVSRPNFAAIVG